MAGLTSERMLSTEALYREEISRHNLLTREEEMELGRRSLAGDLEARNELVQRNLRFVISVARKYRNKGLDLDELVSAGNEGLIKAAAKFDPSKGVRFVSYAAFWISQQLVKELDYSGDTVRPSQTQMVRNRRVRRLVAEARRGGKHLSEEELMKETQFTRARVREALDTDISIMSLDAPVDSGDGSSATLGQFIGDEEGFEDAGEARERWAAIDKAIGDVLDPRTAKVIRLYYGLHPDEPSPWPLTAIGEAIGVSRERARQLKDKGLAILKACRYTDALRELLALEPDNGDEDAAEPESRVSITAARFEFDQGPSQEA
jgi:RNA polymerase primary sigma factor